MCTKIVTFEEACEALKQGRRVCVEDEEEGCTQIGTVVGVECCEDDDSYLIALQQIGRNGRGVVRTYVRMNP